MWRDGRAERSSQQAIDGRGPEGGVEPAHGVGLSVPSRESDVRKARDDRCGVEVGIIGVHREVKMMGRMSETVCDKQAVALLDSYFLREGGSNLEFRAFRC